MLHFSEHLPTPKCKRNLRRLPLGILPELPEFAVGGTAAEASEASEAVEAAAVTAGVTNGLSDRIGSERIESAGLDS